VPPTTIGNISGIGISENDAMKFLQLYAFFFTVHILLEPVSLKSSRRKPRSKKTKEERTVNVLYILNIMKQ
jgi:hypothetical protein